MDWEQYVSEIASDIMKEQSPKRYSWQLLSTMIFSTTEQYVSYHISYLPWFFYNRITDVFISNIIEDP